MKIKIPRTRKRTIQIKRRAFRTAERCSDVSRVHGLRPPWCVRRGATLDGFTVGLTVVYRGRGGGNRRPSLQTGRADFPHPAFQSVSSR